MIIDVLLRSCQGLLVLRDGRENMGYRGFLPVGFPGRLGDRGKIDATGFAVP
jgi:hypothetical protein